MSGQNHRLKSGAPISVKALERIVNTAESTGKWAVAAKALETLCELFPNMPRLRHKQATMFVQMKDDVRAAQAFLMAVDFYLESGSRSMATAVLNQAIKILPSNVELSNRLESLYRGAEWKPLSEEQKLFHYQEFQNQKEKYAEPDEILQVLKGLSEEEYAELIQENEKLAPSVQKDAEQKQARQKPVEKSPQMKLLELFETLKPGSRFLRSLTPDFLTQLAQTSKLRKLTAREALEADRKTCFLVVEGDIETFILVQKTKKSLHLFGSGDFILPLPKEGPNGSSNHSDYSLEAKMHSTILEIPRELIRGLMQSNESVRDYLNDQHQIHSQLLRLRESSLFGEISLEKAKKLQSLFIVQKVGAGSTVIEEGVLREPLFYFILEGQVSVFRRYKSDSPIRLSSLFASDFFGERSFLASTVSMATVKAETDCRFYVLSRGQLDHVIQIYPEFVERLSAVSENRVRIALATEMAEPSAKLEILKTDDVKAQRTLKARDLDELEIFRDLPETQIEEILKAFSKETHEAGTILIRKGAKSQNLFIIKSGSVKEFDYQEDGEEEIVQVYESGYLIGEEGLFVRPISNSYYETLDSTTVYRLSYSQFLSIGALMPKLKAKLHQSFLKKHAERTLRQSSFFKDLSEEHRQLLLKESLESVATDQSIIEQGESKEPCLFILLDGELGVSKNNGKLKIELSKLSPGQIFGESSIITGLSNSASIRALSSSVVIRIPKNRLKPLLKEIPTLGAFVVRTFRERVYFNIETMISAWRSEIFDSETSDPREASERELIQRLVKASKDPGGTAS